MTDARTFQKGFVLLVPALLFGLLVAAQWGTFAGADRQDVAIRYVEPLHETASVLQDEQDTLKRELADLRTQLDDLQRTAAAQSGATRDLQERLDALRARAGLTPLSGEGLLVTLEPAPAAVQERPVCFAPDLTDITNAAWRGGATAVSINGERVVGSSSVYCVGGTIVVNGSLISAPFEVRAIGSGASLMAGFDDPQQLRDLKRRRDDRSIVLRASTMPTLSVGPYTGPIAVRSARIE